MKLETTVTADKDLRLIVITGELTTGDGVIWNDSHAYEESLFKTALVHLGWTPPLQEAETVAGG